MDQYAGKQDAVPFNGQPTAQLTPIQLGGPIGASQATNQLASDKNIQEGPPGIGEEIWDAFVESTAPADTALAPNAEDTKSTAVFPTRELEIAGQLLTVSDPSRLAVAGTTLSAGGSAITLSDTLISLAPSGDLVFGNNAVSPSTSIPIVAGLPLPGVPIPFDIAATAGHGPPRPTEAAVIVGGGQVFTARYSGFSIAGHTLSPGGPGTQISGTPVSLGSSGVLVVGSKTINLAPSLETSVFTVGGQRLTAHPSAFVINGATISASESGVRISGTPVSLDPSGSLVIGTSTICLPTSQPSVFTTDGQTFTLNTITRVSIGDAPLSAGGMNTTATTSGTLVSTSSDSQTNDSNTVPSPTDNGSDPPGTAPIEGAATRRSEVPGEFGVM